MPQVADFNLTYTKLPDYLQYTITCTGCGDLFDIGEKAARIKIDSAVLTLHRSCADQLAYLLRQFVDATTPVAEERVN